MSNMTEIGELLPVSDGTAAALIERDGSLTRTAVKAVVADARDNYLSPLDPPYNAKGDGRKITGAALAAGANTVTVPGAFSESDIGKLVVVLPLPGSTKPTFSATIVGLAGGTAGGPRDTAVTDVTWSNGAVAGASGYVASDDTAALQAWLDDPRLDTRYLPAQYFGFTRGLILRGWYNLVGSPAGELVVMRELPVPTDRPAGARTVPTAMSTPHRQLNVPGVSVQDISIQCSLLADDGFALQWIRELSALRVKISGHRRRGWTQGEARVGPVGADLNDSSQRSTSYGVKVTDCLTWRDSGVVPRPASSNTWTDSATPFKRPQGDAGLSVGFYWDYNCTDSSIYGKTTAMGDQIGFQFHAGNTQVVGAHAWARAAIGMMDIGFNIVSDNVVMQSTYADTAQFAGYWHQGQLGEFYNAKVYNNGGGTNDHAFGWVLTNPNSPRHMWRDCHLRGEDATHALRGTIGTVGGTYIDIPSTGAFNLPGLVVEQFVNSFQIATDWIRRPQQRTGSYTISPTDSGTVLEFNSATPLTVTIPDTLPVGFEVDVLQVGDGQVTLAAAAGVGIEAPAGRASMTRSKRSRVTVRRRQGGLTYGLSGDLSLAHYLTSASLTVASYHNGGVIEYDSTNAGTITVDAASLPADGFVDIVQMGTGQATVAITGGNALVAPDGKVKTRVRYSSIRVRRRSAAGDYVVSGDATA
ncbi:hypothetical protein [Rathayibacter sp. AY1E1]|uniref:hypothetical protein n=1 Tax=Rathayibacter sp. AY1E1 TaxID=2080549 RepID=UPI000D479186|nr:hypothetical protein [Rathayibacter sp. AY1E1]PPH50575.1 hypothetical protein C5C67_13190 [Rathayibacter sp. AY1E1]